jgi:hypothetical protein
MSQSFFSVKGVPLKPLQFTEREETLVSYALSFLLSNLDDGDVENLTGISGNEPTEKAYTDLVSEINALGRRISSLWVSR